MHWQVQNVKPQNLKGISNNQIDQHFDVLYKGYINKLNELESKIQQADTSEANATYSLFRELKKEEVFTADAVRLHQYYFENLGGDGKTTGTIMDLINQDYGSFDTWQKEFVASAMSSRGWVVLGFDWQDQRVHTYMTDIHSEAVWDCTPIMVLDMYEHAYWLDFGANKKAYIEAFMNNLDWSVVNKRIQYLNVMQRRRAA